MTDDQKLRNRQIFVIFEPNFTPKNDITGFQKFLTPKLSFTVDLKMYFVFAYPSGKRENQYTKFKTPGSRGRGQFKISSIPWLEHIPTEYFGEKSKHIHCKTKKN